MGPPQPALGTGRATGREVFDWILDQGYYSEKDTSNVIRQVLEAVAYLHSLKIVHRNLKVGAGGPRWAQAPMGAGAASSRSCSLRWQLENLVYYNRLKNSKIVISDFHLAKLENGLIKEPCGTPEYLGEGELGRHGEGAGGTDCLSPGSVFWKVPALLVGPSR